MYKIITLPCGHAIHDIETYEQAMNIAAQCDDDIVHVLDEDDMVVDSFEKEFEYAWE